MGRRKIEIKKIENKAYLKATFSKRRKGLFTKAKELCKLCGAVVAILTISPGGRFYNFGHPDVDSIVSRYCEDEGMVREFVNEDSDTIGDDHGIASTSHEEDEDDEFVNEDDEDYVSESEEVKDEEEDEEVDEDVLPIDMVTSDNADEEEEEEPVEEIKEMNLIDKIDERDWRTRMSMSQQKFWWDEEEPTDVEQRQMYLQSLTQLRNNVKSLLSERKMRESYAEDFISMI